jgi:hypothetical protein
MSFFQYLTKEIKSNISRNLINIPGWRTNRKIVVIESDDWGSIRMPSATVFKYLLSKGIRVDQSPYCKFDSLETPDDIDALLCVLTRFKDFSGNHPIFTFNTVVANPTFKKIEDSGFKEYYYEPFTETYKQYPQTAFTFSVINQGIKASLLKPQFHGREHVNVRLWLNLLQNGNPAFIEAFKKNMWGLSTDVIRFQENNIQAAFDYRKDTEIAFLKNSIIEGTDLFESIFGFRSSSFIPNNFIFPSLLENELIRNDIKILQGMKYKISPLNKHNKREYSRRSTGKSNKSGLVDLVRNCSFEPSVVGGNAESEAMKCLKEIGNSFFWRKPAIISTHRINFMGGLSERNRRLNLLALSFLLKNIVIKWPEVEFMTSDKLGLLIDDEFI